MKNNMGFDPETFAFEVICVYLCLSAEDAFRLRVFK